MSSEKQTGHNLGLAERIRDRLRTLGYWKHERPDVRRFCEERGYTTQYVYGWLRGRRPTFDYVTRLASDLGVTVEWLALGHEDAPRDRGRLASVRDQPVLGHLVGAGDGDARSGGDPARSASKRGKVIEHPLARVGLLMDRLSRLEKELQSTVRACRESEERFRGIFQNGPLGMVIFDPDTLRVVEVNERFAELLGHAVEEILGADVFDWTEPRDRDAARALAAEVAAGGRPHASQESRFLTRFGDVLWAHVTWIVIRGGDGAAQYGVAMIEDITERRAVEERLKSFVAGVPVGLYRSSATGELLAANPAFLSILGYDSSESLSRINSVDLFVDRENRRQWLAGFEGNGTVRDFEQQLRRRNGTVIWVRDRARVIHDADGRVRWFEGALEDITARKRAEDAARALAEIGRDLAGSLDLARTTRILVATLLRLLQARRATLFQLDSSGHRLTCVAAAGVSDPREWIGQSMPAHHGLSGRAIDEGRLIATPDLLADPAIIVPDWVRERLRREGHGSALAVPLNARGRTLGCLSIGAALGRVFVDDELGLVAAFADQAALALDNARLYEEADRRRRTAESLAEIGRLLSRSLDPDEVGRRIVDTVLELMAVQLAVLYRRDATTGALYAIASAGATGPTGEWRPVLPRGHGVAGLAALEGHPVFAANPLTDPRIVYPDDVRASLAQMPLRSVLAVPLVVQDGVIGSLGIGDSVGRVFHDDEIRLAQAFAAQAAIAMENARLFAESRLRSPGLS